MKRLHCLRRAKIDTCRILPLLGLGLIREASVHSFFGLVEACCNFRRRGKVLVGGKEERETVNC